MFKILIGHLIARCNFDIPTIVYIIVCKLQVKHRVRSDNFIIQWYSLWKSTDYLYEMVTGKSRVGNKQKSGRKRQREWIKGVRDGVQQATRNGMGWKWTLEMIRENLGINRTNKRESNWIQKDFRWFPNCWSVPWLLFS